MRDLVDTSMRRFDAILLLLTEGCDELGAVETAARLASGNGARLKVLELRRPARSWLRRLADGGRWATLPVERLVLEHRRVELQARLAVSMGLDAARRVEIAVAQASVDDALQRELRGFCPSLIVTGGPPGKRLGRDLRRLLRGSPVPVLTCGDGDVGHPRRILAGVSASAGQGGEREAIDREVLERARDLAMAVGAELDVVHSWVPYGAQLIQGRGRGSATEAAAHARLVGEDRRRALRRTLRSVDLSGVSHRSELIKGEAAEVIVELAGRRGSDLVVVGSVGRSGIAGAIVGNTAEEVVARARCAVLTVKILPVPASGVAASRREGRGPAGTLEVST